MHAHPDSSKFPSFTLQGSQKFGAALPHHGGNRAGVRGKFQLPVALVGNANAQGERPRQVPADDLRQSFLAVAARRPGGQRRVGTKDTLQRLGGTHHGGNGGGTAVAGADRPDGERLGGTRLNIILVSSATARARSLTLDWRHWTLGGIGLAVVFVAFTGVFNFVTLRYAAAIQHPWLQAIVLADQRQEALKTQELVHGHLNAMALRLGELQARMMRLDGLGERLAKVAGLQPQEFPSLQPGRPRGAAAPNPRCRRGRCRLPSSRNCWPSSAASWKSAPTSSASSRRCSSPTRPTASSCRRWPPIVDGWFSSNFGYRIDPFTGMQSFHEGIDFPADSGTPVVAAASGKVIESGYQPQYGKIVVIDHGNGLVSRYAHASAGLRERRRPRGARPAGGVGRARRAARPARICISRFG